MMNEFNDVSHCHRNHVVNIPTYWGILHSDNIVMNLFSFYDP
jgi:hypothetical protein